MARTILPMTSDPVDHRPLRIAGRGEVQEGEVVDVEARREVRPLRAPTIPAATFVQLLCGLCALVGLFVVVAEVASPTLAAGVVALTAGVIGVALSALREAGRI